MVKQKTKLFTALCGLALAVIVGIDPVEAFKPKANVQKTNMLESVGKGNTFLIDSIRGYCYPADYECGVTANGTTLKGIWMEIK